ncbi:hypothetical protein FKP32DRAFT_1672616 [Trametes sanguinea]|nr:hypothetical protein FKP32DRAFT_1672616 [Trametes sanguinea]
MSAAPGDPVIVQLISSSLLSARMAMGCIALFAYEYLITLDQEIRLIWARKKTGAAMLFLVIRYLALLSVVVINAASFAPLSTKVASVVQLMLYPSYAVFSSLRALALSGLNVPLAALVFLLACGPFAVNMWVLTRLDITGEILPIVGCVDVSNQTLNEAKIGADDESNCVSISRPCVIASDILLVAITWWHAARYGQNWPAHERVPSLTRVMTVNGTLYFLVLTVLNVLHLILTILSFVTVEENTSVATIFTDSLTAILICRFLLALHSANLRTIGQGSGESQLGGLSDNLNAGAVTLRFASTIVSSMGGSLDRYGGDTAPADDIAASDAFPGGDVLE